MQNFKHEPVLVTMITFDSIFLLLTPRYAAIVLPCNVMEHDGERYVVPSAEMMAGTHFLICPGIRDDVQHVPTTVVPPGCLPRELNVLTAAKVTGENANILKAALKIRCLASDSIEVVLKVFVKRAFKLKLALAVLY